MSRRVLTCEVCGQLAPFGVYVEDADGRPGRLWACETHRDQVRAMAAARTPPQADLERRDASP